MSSRLASTRCRRPSDPGAAKITALTEPTDLTTGLITAKVLAALSSHTPYALTATAKGSHIVFTNDPAASGALADSANFKAAMAGMPAKTLLAGYVNIGAMLTPSRAGSRPTPSTSTASAPTKASMAPISSSAPD